MRLAPQRMKALRKVPPRLERDDLVSVLKVVTNTHELLDRHLAHRHRLAGACASRADVPDQTTRRVVRAIGRRMGRELAIRTEVALAFPLVFLILPCGSHWRYYERVWRGRRGGGRGAGERSSSPGAQISSSSPLQKQPAMHDSH